MAMNLKGSLIAAIRELRQIPEDDLVERRYQKFRGMGVFEEQLAANAE
jgi:acetyl-CoA carboxylase alpha subunit